MNSLERMNPLISVIIPAHNNETTIATAIKSIQNQTYPRLEIIVVDDNSTDRTGDVVAEFITVRYLSLHFDDPHRFNHRGVNINAGWMARNYGVDHAQGDWITFQDADDASMRNRIEVQLALAQKYDSNHVCINWQKFDDELIDKILDIEPYLAQPDAIIGSERLKELARRTQGIGCRLPFHRFIPFPIKRRLHSFFQSWEPYPFAGNSPLVRREVLKQIRFRPRNRRVWPSERGRGADRDFNFHVALTFQNSLCVNIPLYLWRV